MCLACDKVGIRLGMDRYIYWIILRRIRRPLLVPFMSDCQISKAGAKNIRLFKIVSVFAEGDSNSDKMWHFWHLGKIMISKVHLLAGYCYSWHFTFYIHGQNIFHWQILTFNYWTPRAKRAGSYQTFTTFNFQPSTKCTQKCHQNHHFWEASKASPE